MVLLWFGSGFGLAGGGGHGWCGVAGCGFVFWGWLVFWVLVASSVWGCGGPVVVWWSCCGLVLVFGVVGGGG